MGSGTFIRPLVEVIQALTCDIQLCKKINKICYVNQVAIKASPNKRQIHSLAWHINVSRGTKPKHKLSNIDVSRETQ